MLFPISYLNVPMNNPKFSNKLKFGVGGWGSVSQAFNPSPLQLMTLV